MDERCKNNFSTYRAHYIPKPVENVRYLGEDVKKRVHEYKDPVKVSFKKFLTLAPTPKKQSEEVDHFYERSKDIYPWMSDITQGQSAEKTIVKRGEIFDGRSQYQVDFCDLETEVAEREKELRNRLILPNDTVLTTTSQRCSYRNPIVLNSRAYVKDELFREESSLNPNYKVRNILKVTTGNTEYMGCIGKLGLQIIEEQLHGIKTYYEG